MKADLADWLSQIRSSGAARTGATAGRPFPHVSGAFIAEHEHREGFWGGGVRYGGWDEMDLPATPRSATRLVGHDLPDGAYDWSPLLGAMT